MTKPKLVRPAKGLPVNFRERRRHAKSPWFIEVHTQKIVNPSYMDINEFIRLLKEAAEEIVNPTVDLDTSYEYGESYTHVVVEGWREASELEIEKARAEYIAQTEQQKKWEERQIEQLRVKRPELFND